MDIGMLHLHTTVIIIFLLSFVFKTVLLLADKIDLLEKIKAKTKWVEMVLGTLILATGIYLLARQQVFPTWLIVKLIIVVIAIPLGIVGLKRNKKSLAVIALLGFIYIYGMSETKSPAMKPHQYAEDNQDLKLAGQEIYSNECARCHGGKGNASLYGAKDLTQTTLSKQKSMEIIKNGKGAMPAFGSKLKDNQIEAVAEYIQGLKE